VSVEAQAVALAVLFAVLVAWWRVIPREYERVKASVKERQ